MRRLCRFGDFGFVIFESSNQDFHYEDLKSLD